MSFYHRIIKFIENNILPIKSFIILVLGFTALFMDKKDTWIDFSWLLYIALMIILLCLEWYDSYLNQISPINKVKKYLADVGGWNSSGSDNYQDYYISAPEFTIQTKEVGNHLDYRQEWVRGEIGYHYTSGNGAYYREIYYHKTKLQEIHIVIFDGGKKTIVAPSWEPVGKGRIYYYLKDSIEYAYQLFQSSDNKDHSKKITKKNSNGYFDIPVFKNKDELNRFIVFCNVKSENIPSKNDDEQNDIFYDLINKYQEFIRIKTTQIRPL